MVVVLIAQQDQTRTRPWRFPLTRPLWEKLGEQAGAYVADRYAVVHPTQVHQVPLRSLATAIQHSLRRADAVFRMPGAN